MGGRDVQAGAGALAGAARNVDGARAGAFVWPVRVYYEDTDSTGLVYHASYLRFLERARTEWLRSHGFELGEVAERHGVLFTVSRLAIDYVKPATFSDELEVSVEVERVGAASLHLAQVVRRADGELLCRATVRIACVDAGAMRPSALPKTMISELKRDRRSITA